MIEKLLTALRGTKSIGAAWIAVFLVPYVQAHFGITLTNQDVLVISAAGATFFRTISTGKAFEGLREVLAGKAKLSEAQRVEAQHIARTEIKRYLEEGTHG